MWIYREISAPVLFIWAQIEPDIRWRNNYFRLKWGGLVEPHDRKIHLLKKQKNEHREIGDGAEKKDGPSKKN